MKKIQRQVKARRAGGAVMAVILAFVPLAASPFIFTSCDTNEYTLCAVCERPSSDCICNIQREFQITVQFYYILDPINPTPVEDLILSSAEVRIIDKTNGDTSLEGQSSMLNLQDAFDLFESRTAEDRSDRTNASVLHRGITINIVVGEEKADLYAQFTIINHNTIYANQASLEYLTPARIGNRLLDAFQVLRQEHPVTQQSTSAVTR